MKNFAMAALFLAFGTVAVLAADLPVKARPVVIDPGYNWSGFYVGVNGGYAWNNANDVVVSGTPVITVSQSGAVPFAVGGLRPEGYLVGGQVGWNYQFGAGLVGIEGDFDFADIKDSRNVDLPVLGPAARTSASEKIDFFGTVRGRLGGIVSQRLLLFATGGLAYANVKDSANINEFFNAPVIGRQFIANASDLRFGWTVGAGAEWAFASNWSVKGEYLYYDLGSPTITGSQTNPVDTEFATYSFSTRGNIVKAGLNYRFDGGGPIVARY
ncbi:outer membrane protein [Bradyrhizobium sp. Bra64]|uniref:outer membrane protein n=1 Tax=Bradyrhizobium sp. Bra64 TaxID=2926009 RepID=UPI002119A751|nr:outer membrane protein [Bradyrhizobium sp. Bra64]